MCEVQARRTDSLSLSLSGGLVCNTFVVVRGRREAFLMSDHECIVHCSPEAPGEVITHTAANQLRKLNFALLNAYYARNTVPTASPTDQGRPNFQLSPRQPQPAAGSNKVQCSSNKQPHLRARIRGGELLCRGGYGRCLVPPRAPQYDTVGFNLFVTSSSTPHSDLTPLPHTTYNSDSANTET